MGILAKLFGRKPQRNLASTNTNMEASYKERSKALAAAKMEAERSATVRQEPQARNPIEECRRWLADYQQRANIPGAKYDDISEFIKCIKEVGGIGTPEAVIVLEQVRTQRMFANIVVAAVDAINQAKFGSEKPVERCERYLAQQEEWTKNFVGKPLANFEFGTCFAELKTLNTPEAIEILKKAAEADYLFPGARELARAALDQEPRKKAAAPGKYDGGAPSFGGDLDGFLADARRLIERLPACDRGVVLEQYCDYTSSHELARPREAADSAEVIQYLREWPMQNKSRSSFKRFSIRYEFNPVRADGGYVQPMAFHDGQGGSYARSCQAAPS